MNFTIIRGLPGSGKSTMGRKLSEKSGAVLLEPDMFCIENGKYVFSPERYAAAIERSYMILELLTGPEFDRKSAKLRPDIIFTDILPMAADISELIKHINPEYKIHLITIKSIPEMRKCSNCHAVNPRHLSRFFRIFEDVEYEQGKLILNGRLYSENEE